MNSSFFLAISREKKTFSSSFFQNFDSIPHVSDYDVGFFGGSVALADYCPYIQEFTWRSNNVVVRGSHCMYSENNPSAERNFALEKYGTRSKCFDHTDKMWEERSCVQVRQWQHWGSGCYQYYCSNDNRLVINVMGRNFTCFYPQQEIPISLMSNEWLHQGSVVCPPCEDICGEELRRRGERGCAGGVLPPKGYVYPTDGLTCGSEGTLLGSSRNAALVTTVVVTLLALLA